MSVKKAVGLRFTVKPEHEAEILELYLKAGFSPMSIEKNDDGNIVFVLPKVSDDLMYKLITAVPPHYSAIQGVVVGSRQTN